MSGWKKLAAASAADDVISPEAVSFDGSNDYLQRSFSEIVRSAMTFSAWVYASPYTNNKTFFRNGATTAPFEFNVQVQTDGDLEFRLTTGNQSKSAFASNKFFGFNTWNHILFSIDASTGAAQLYVNDRNVGISTLGVAGEDIKPLLNNFQIMKGEGTGEAKGRVANVFVDYTYRNLGTESNRRLFITDELKPADGLADLSPIIYLPMKSADTAGDNLGTGGDFTVYGTLDTAARGPNQNNTFASYFDGSDDFLEHTGAPTGTANNKTMTLSCSIKRGPNGTERLFYIESELVGNQGRMDVLWLNNYFSLSLDDESNSRVLQFNYAPDNPIGTYVNISFSVDMSDTSKRHVYVDGVDVTSNVTWSTYNNANLDLDIADRYSIMSRVTDDFPGGNGTSNGDLCNFWFDDSYVADLSVFYDSETDSPVYLGFNGEVPTGSSPLIYLPLRASNPGQNFGTGGDFDVNSRPGGARSTSEFLARSARFDNGSDQLTVGVSTGNVSTISACFAFKIYSGSASTLNFVRSGSTYWGFTVGRSGSSVLEFFVSNNANQELRFRVNGFDPFSNDWHTVLLKFSSSTSVSDSKVYINGTEYSLSKVSDEASNYVFDLSSNTITVFGTSSFEYDLGPFYLYNGSIDFSLESNRNLFIDQLGYLKNLTPAIDASDIPTPLIYTKFEDPDDLGANSGSLGDFTVSGSIDRGADVDIDTN